MANLVTFNGSNYIIPDVGETGWGSNVTSYLIAIAAGAFQKTGGSFALTAEADFGNSFGLKALYLRSETANGANAGFIKMAPSDTVSWRNVANNADLQMGVDSSDNLLFNGHIISSSGGSLEFPNGTAATPGIASISYPNTGIFIPSAQALGFTTAGVLGLTIENSQIVNAVNSVITTKSLDNSFIGFRVINTSGGIAAEAVSDVAAGTGGCGILSSGSGNTDTYMGIPKANTSQFRSDGGGAGLFISTAGGGGPMYIGTSGTMAIAIDTSQQMSLKGAVNGSTISLNGAAQFNVFNTSAGVSAHADLNVVNDLSDNTNLKIFSSGYTGTLYGITQGRYALLNNGAGFGLMINTNSGPMYLGTANTKAVTIDTSQNIILTGSLSTPSFIELLNQGTLRFQDASTHVITFQAPSSATSFSYAWPGTAPTSGQVLSSTSGGIMSWTTPVPSASPTFTGTVTAANLALTDTSNQIVLGTTRTATLTAPTPATSSRTYTFPDLIGDYSVVATIGAQTIAGAKTLSSALTITPTTNQLVLGVTNTTTISATAPTASRVYTIPDVGGNANFILDAGGQALAGTSLVLSDTTNQIRLGTSGSHNTLLSATNPAANITVTIPDLGASYSIVGTAGSQTIAGAKTFSNNVAMTSSNSGAQNIVSVANTNTAVASDAKFLATSNTASGGDAYTQYTNGTINWSAGLDSSDSGKYKLSASSTLGTTDNFVMDTSGNATLTGSMTATAISGTTGSFSSAVTITPTTNQLVLGTTRTVTISASQPATSSRTYTIPDQGAAANFLMSAAAQTITGVQTFSGQINANFSGTGGNPIHGTNTNDNASAGYIGEQMESTVTTSINTGTSGAYFDVTSLSLTAGDWDVFGLVEFIRNAATFTSTDILMGIGTATGNNASGLTNGTTLNEWGGTIIPVTFTNFALTIGMVRVSITGTTTYYLKGYVDTFSAGQPKVKGRMTARRVH